MSEHRCRRCLLSEYDPLGIYNEVTELINAIPADMRADDDVYKIRLGICLDCKDLLRGTCLLCGCYTELRAKKADAVCPAGKW